MRSITPYFDGIEEPQNYIIKDTTNTTNEIMVIKILFFCTFFSHDET